MTRSLLCRCLERRYVCFLPCLCLPVALACDVVGHSHTTCRAPRSRARTTPVSAGGGSVYFDAFTARSLHRMPSASTPAGRPQRVFRDVPATHPPILGRHL